ncbi:MAG TPA: methyltransferase domain-containing protein [Steroidobacteraceae bacterium]|nr:methyltransferase domain-containing protein [Steroidobacteraceae bacterium]
MHPVHAQAGDADERRYPAPVAARRARAVAELLELTPGGSVLDLGVGPAGLLLDAIAQHRCEGTGLVASEAMAEAARASAEREGLAGLVEFRLDDAYSPQRRLDAILGVAAEPAARIEEVGARCFGWLKVGGLFVYGEPFFRRPPAPPYRALLGAAAEGLRLPGISARAIVAAGFELTLTAVLSESEWDAHESAAYRARLRRAAAHADRAAAAELRAEAERWYQAYWRYGRDTLGYALHAFRKPRHALYVV